MNKIIKKIVILMCRIKKELKMKKILSILTVFTIMMMTVLQAFANSAQEALNFFNSFSKIHYSEEKYLVLTLKENNYKDIKDIENKDLGYIKNDLTNINKAIEKLDKKVKTEKKEYTKGLPCGASG